MMSYSSLVLAEIGRPLFDNQWLALFVILGSATAFLHAIVAFRRSLAPHQKAEPAKPAEPIANAIPVSTPPALTPPVPVPSSEPSVEIFAAIAAAVAFTLGAKARVAAINTVSTQSTSDGALQWSLEGRRQIYSSHKVR